MSTKINQIKALSKLREELLGPDSHWIMSDRERPYFSMNRDVIGAIRRKLIRLRGPTQTPSQYDARMAEEAATDEAFWAESRYHTRREIEADQVPGVTFNGKPLQASDWQ